MTIISRNTLCISIIAICISNYLYIKDYDIAKANALRQWTPVSALNALSVAKDRLFPGCDIIFRGWFNSSWVQHTLQMLNVDKLHLLGVEATLETCNTITVRS